MKQYMIRIRPCQNISPRKGSGMPVGKRNIGKTFMPEGTGHFLRIIVAADSLRILIIRSPQRPGGVSIACDFRDQNGIKSVKIVDRKSLIDARLLGRTGKLGASVISVTFAVTSVSLSQGP